MYAKKLFLIALCSIIAVGLYAQCALTISSFPYTEDFELTDGSWVAGGSNSDWAWGTPTKATITNAGGGSKCWIIGGTSGNTYNSNQESYLETPCFDFSFITNPLIRFKVFWETEKDYDGANFQYSLDQGATWQNVGAFGDLVDCNNDGWYNHSAINFLSTLANPKHGWSGNIQPTLGSCQGGGGSGAWKDAKHLVSNLSAQPSVKFRFTFGSGSTCNNYDGFAIDEFHIEDMVVLTAFTLVDSSSYDCINGQMIATPQGGVAPYTYQWSNNSSNNSIGQINLGTYTVTVTDANGCTATASSEMYSLDKVNVAINTTDDSCNNKKGLISLEILSGPYLSHQWQGFATTSDTLFGLAAGSYTLSIFDTKNCKTDYIISIADYSVIQFDSNATSYLCPPANITLTPGNFATYQWSTNDTTPTITTDIPGTYIVTVTDTAGCSGVDSFVVETYCFDSEVFVPSAFTPNDDFVNELFLPVVAYSNIFEFNVYNRWGKEIFTSKNPSMGWDGVYQNQKCPSGVYAYSVTFGDSIDNLQTKRGFFNLIR